MPTKKDKFILINSIIGAVTGIVLNILLVPVYKSIGSSVVWVSSEIMVLISAQIFVRKSLKIVMPIKKLAISFVLALPIYLICLWIGIFDIASEVEMVLSGIFSFSYYSLVLYFVIKNTVFVSIVNRTLILIKNRVKK